MVDRKHFDKFLRFRAVSNGVTQRQLARKLFIKDHGTVFTVLRSIQDAPYKSDERRERFLILRHDLDVQKLTFEAYMNMNRVSAGPLAHLKTASRMCGT